MISNDTRTKWRNKVQAIIDAQDAKQLVLTEWEIGFIDSIDDRCSKGYDLSFRQAKKLGNIYDKVG